MEQQLDRIIKEGIHTGVRIEVLMREGDPTEEVVKTVKEKKIDLLVMIAHEEGHLESSCSSRVTMSRPKRMPCSILVVEEPHRELW